MLAAEKSVAVPHELMDRVFEARRRSDELFSLVRENALYERPIPERHRIIFYLGHLEAFDWNLLNGSVFGMKSVHPEFDRLFAFGIDPVGGGLPSDLPSDWPAADVVRDYVSNIRNRLDFNLEKVILEPHFRTDLRADDRTNDGFSLGALLNVAIEHRLMHARRCSRERSKQYRRILLARQSDTGSSTCRAASRYSGLREMLKILGGTTSMKLTRSTFLRLRLISTR
jgi:iron(II)-dependent oxidoreductase